MNNRLFHGFFTPFGPEHDRNSNDNTAADLVQRLLQPADSPKDDWDPTTLNSACRAVAANRDGSVPRIHTVIPCPRQQRGALPVVEYAQLLAQSYELHVHCSLKNNTITVTFERPCNS